MFSKILDKATSVVDSRFLLVALFPVIVFGAAVSLLLAELDSSLLSDRETAWERWSGWQQFLVVVALVAALFVLGYVLYVSITPLTRLFEGYFGPTAWLGELLEFGKRAATLDEDPLSYRKHPGPAEWFPTRLGNSVRAAEVHSREAYGMDAVVLWPALVAQLPVGMTKSIDAARMSMDFLIVVSFGSILYGVFGGVAVAVAQGGRILWLGVVVGSVAVAYASYSGAVAAARDYADQIRTAFDEYRFDLLKSLRLPLPANRPEEKRLWREVNEIVRGSEPADWWLYQHPEGENDRPPAVVDPVRA